MAQSQTGNAIRSHSPFLLCLGFHRFLTAQTAPPRPEFEISNVKPNHSGAAEHPSSVKGSQVSFRNTSIVELFPLAFQRKDDLIVAGPAWLRTKRFDITAKAPPNTSEVTLGLMVQSLLAKEFKLAFHEEQRPQEAFVPEVAPSGPKLREVPADPSRPDCSRGGTTELLVVECPAVTIANLIPRLLFAARDFIDRPIVDQTNCRSNRRSHPLSGTHDATRPQTRAAQSAGAGNRNRPRRATRKLSPVGQAILSPVFQKSAVFKR